MTLNESNTQMESKCKETEMVLNVTQLVQSRLLNNPAAAAERLGPDFFKFVLMQYTQY